MDKNYNFTFWTIGAFTQLRNIGVIPDDWLEDQTVILHGKGVSEWDQLDASGYRPDDRLIGAVVTRTEMGIKERHKPDVFSVICLYRDNEIRQDLERLLDEGMSIEEILKLCD